jgi:Protein of unknown function (DUF992)
MIRLWATIFAACLVATAAGADERADADVGVLTCTLAEPTPEPVSAGGGQPRKVLCAFKPTTGPEETYAGAIQAFSPEGVQFKVLIWRVKLTPGAKVEPGLLQQAYAADQATPSGQTPVMIGAANSSIVLHSMADREEGSASRTDKAPNTDFIVLSIELKLLSAQG